MGEKIKTLAKGKLKNSDLEIELNKADSKGGLRSVHIQNENYRFDMDEIEFYKIATGIISAKRKLLKLKGDL